jgi:hypothetical protein
MIAGTNLSPGGIIRIITHNITGIDRKTYKYRHAPHFPTPNSIMNEPITHVSAQTSWVVIPPLPSLIGEQNSIAAPNDKRKPGIAKKRNKNTVSKRFNIVFFIPDHSLSRDSISMVFFQASNFKTGSHWLDDLPSTIQCAPIMTGTTVNVHSSS